MSERPPADAPLDLSFPLKILVVPSCWGLDSLQYLYRGESAELLDI